MIDWLKPSRIEPEVAPTIELNDVALPITLKRHATAKRMTMRLAPDGSEVRITLPRWGRSGDAIDFARSRAEWLATQHAKVPKHTPLGPGSTVQFRGRDVQVEWDASLPRKPVFEDGLITIGGPQAGIAGRVQRWLEGCALDLFEADIAHYTKVAALDPVPVGLSRAQRRWGSCSESSSSKTKRIRLNWRLIQAPDAVRRSVAAHEVAHLVHFDHSAAFHALLGEIYEGDIKEADQWLKAHGRELYSAFG